MRRIKREGDGNEEVGMGGGKQEREDDKVKKAKWKLQKKKN